MKRSIWKFFGIILAVLGVGVVWSLTPADSGFKQASTWQQLAEPGHLSAAHAHLEDNCAACHTSVIGIETAKCIVCHANDESILQRQPTSFHASISSCQECHPEHRGLDQRPTNMEHSALAQIGLRQLADDEASDSESQLTAMRL
ncbi:MAG: cytochrome c3 family protein, partial [Planctomycetales bacterium]|nr:cytochrome c3 family protein [Planctomycetales bacterium]